MGAALDYFDQTVELLQSIRSSQQEAISRAADICTESIANGGLVFLFGAGHSRMMCEEMDSASGWLCWFLCLCRAGCF